MHLPRSFVCLCCLTLMGLCSAESLVGFRGNGSGIFPVTGVPTTWDIEKGTNVVWKAVLPDIALSEPVVVGDRILVTAEPEWLLCFDTATGKECWRVEISALEGLDPAVQAKHKETLIKVIALWKSGAQGKESYNAIKEDTEKLKKDCGIEMVQNWLFGNLGYAAATPVSDGKYVWARFATGSIGCVEIATGKKVWQRRNPSNSGLWMQGAQFAVLADRMYFIENLPKGASGDPRTQKQVTGLETATGKEVWHSKPIPKGDHGYASGLLVVNIGGKPYLATSNGQVLDTTSGEILVDGLGNCAYSTNAYSVPDAVCFGRYRIRLKNEGGKIIALDPTAAEPKVTERAVIFGESAYIAQATELSVTAVSSTKPPIRVMYGFKGDGNGKRAALPIVAGDLLYCPAIDGYLAVVKPGAKPEVVALNRFPDRITASCTAAPGRLYVRTMTTLYALGAK